MKFDGTQTAGEPIKNLINSEAAAALIRTVEGEPWPKGFLINCSRDRKVYSLRVLLPNLIYGGSQFEEVANVRFRDGTCMDSQHWPKINALIDLIWSLDDYRRKED